MCLNLSKCLSYLMTQLKVSKLERVNFTQTDGDSKQHTHLHRLGNGCSGPESLGHVLW